jgi:membrane-bound lytic murein transglycosylase B
MSGFYKFISFVILYTVLALGYSEASTNDDFNKWLIEYKNFALKKGISQKTVEQTFANTKFIEKIIVYDRKQPEFYEDTLTYVKKRANLIRINNAKKLLNKNKKLFKEVEINFSVEKEILLALWGIETNFGKHVGKMDIVSALATLSFDKRRSEFFSQQLLILLELIDNDTINPNTLFGSWAGAYGNFQFMPSTIKRYALDYDGNKKIELKKSLNDALASAANYLNQIGWSKNQPCFLRVKIQNNINKKYINTSARNITNRLSIKKWSGKGVTNFDGSKLSPNPTAALILPDNKENSPAYLVFKNYEHILKWNRSLRFGISVCTLANKIKI